MRKLVMLAVLLTFVVSVAVYGQTARGADAYSFSTIDVPGSNSTFASGINVLGRTVGYYVNRDGTHGFVLGSDGFSTIDFPGAKWTAAYGINSAGQIVGAYGASEVTGRRGFLLSGGVFSSFEVPNSMDTVARGINSRGQIVGDFMGPDGARHGFLLSGGNYSTVDFPESGGGMASAINDNGQIAGLAGAGAGAKGFLYSGGFTRVQFPESNYTEILGLNSLGDIVGQTSGGPGAPSKGFYRSGAGFVLIEVPEYPSSWDARGINDLGQIVGTFTDREGKTHGYRATPTALRLGPSASEGVTRISDGSRGRGNSQNTTGEQDGDRGAQVAAVRDARAKTQALENIVRPLEATRSALGRASGALERSVVNAPDMEKERELAVGRAMAGIALAVEDVGAAIAFANANPPAGLSAKPQGVKANMKFPDGERGRNPSLQIALNNLNSALDSLTSAPGGDLGGHRAKITDDIAAAASHIVAANRAPREYGMRGRERPKTATPADPPFPPIRK